MASITFNTSAGNYTTGASWIGNVAPTAADDALIVSTSGTPTIDTGAVSRSIDFNTFTGTTVGTANTLTLGDATAGAGNRALRFVAGQTVTAFPITFISTSATVQTVDFAGKTTGQVIFNAASNGSWQYTGAHTTGALVAGAVTLTKGTLDINGQTVSWNTFASSNANVRSLILGSATVNITGTTGGTPWDFTTATNLTFSGASSTINFTSGAAAMQGGGKAYGTVTIGNSGTFGLNNSGGSFVNLSRTATATKTDGFRLDSSFTVSGILTLAGNSSINRLSIFSNTVGAQQTITNTGTTMTISNSDFMDVKFTTTWDASAQTDIGDAGGNSGITFPASVTQTATGTASFTWSTHGWTTRVPLPQDDVVINNAFIAGRTVTLDMPRAGRNIDFTGATGTPSFAISADTSIFGSVTLISGMSDVSGAFTITFRGRGSHTITSAGRSFAQILAFTAPGGTYTLQDALTNTNSFSLTNGTFVSNNFTVTTTLFSMSATTTKAATLGTSTINLTGTAANNIVNISAIGTTLSAASSTFMISAASANTRTFVGGSQIFGTLTYTVAGSTGQLSVTGSNTFSTINFYDITNARTLAFTAATTTTITQANGFNVRGTAGKLMSVQSITASTHTLSSANNQSCDYLFLTNSIATGGGTWYAGSHSTDNGGNSGWIFADAPVGGGGSGSGTGALQSNKNLQNIRNLM